MTLEGGALSDDRLFAAGTFSFFQKFGSARVSESVRVDVDDEHYRGTAAASFSSGAFSLGGRYQLDRGARVHLGGVASSVLPRSAYVHRILDPALPIQTLTGDDYTGWRVETALSGLTAFYQRHDLDPTSLSLAGLEVKVSAAPSPILRLPALDLTLGAAHILDGPLEGETKWWINMRWRP